MSIYIYKVKITGMALPITETSTEHIICKKRGDGQYSIKKCYQKYLLCNNGKGMIMKCEQGQVFSYYKQRCVFQWENSQCLNKESTGYTRMKIDYRIEDKGSFLLYMFNHAYLCFLLKIRCLPLKLFQRASCSFKITNYFIVILFYEGITDCRCRGRSDGLYAEGCSEKFYACSNGISYGLECPKELVFNEVAGYCDYRQNVVDCGGRSAIYSLADSSE